MNAWNSISNAIDKEGLFQYYILKNILIFIAIEIASVQMFQQHIFRCYFKSNPKFL